MIYGNTQSLFYELFYELILNPKLELPIVYPYPGCVTLPTFTLLKERIDNNNKQSKVLKTINQTERMPNSTATFNDENNNEIVDEITTINTKTKKTLNIINQ